MRHILSCGFLLLLAMQYLHAQQAPLIDVRNAVAEFISDDEIPNFTIRGIYVVGKVDTMKAVIKTSTVRALGSEYARYKPVLNSITWVPIDSVSSEVFVSVRLEGTSIPLPPDSVRGSVRLTVSAATWNGEDWLGTTSEPFVVPVANVGVPKPLISVAALKITRTEDPTKLGAFVITGIKLSIPSADSVNRVPDVREFDYGDVVATIDKKTFRTVDRERDGLRVVSLHAELSSNGTVIINGVLEGEAFPSAVANQPYSMSIVLKARLRHGNVLSPFRVRTIKIMAP